MPAALVELFEGHSEDIAGKLSVTVPYGIFAAADEAAARVCALTIPTTYNSLPRQSITGFEQINETTWKVVARFAQPDASGGSDPATLTATYSFETGGGTQNVKQSYTGEARRYSAADGSTGSATESAINFDKEAVHGVDIVVPQYQFSETHWFAPGLVTEAYKNTVGAYTGWINNATFRGFPAGEVLFLGASGSQQANSYWQITFKFAVQPNRTSLDIGNSGIVVDAKKGWQYLWIRYEDAIEGTGANKHHIKKAVAAYVEAVYRAADLETVLGL